MLTTRRAFIETMARPALLVAASCALPSVVPRPAVAGSRSADAPDATTARSDASGGAGMTFPDGRTTGHASAPGFPGKLIPAAHSTVSENGGVFRFNRFEGLDLTGSGNHFYGCHFVSNWTDGWNIIIRAGAANNRFDYCTISPPEGVVIPHPDWPSAGAGIPAPAGHPDASSYQIDGNAGYQYGFRILSGEGTIIDHCDIWGFANAIDLAGGSNTTVTNTWIHDAAFESPKGYHTDGIGYLDGGVPPRHVLIRNCTIASLGNTNGIAFQAASAPYDDIVVDHCFLSGFGYTVDLCHNVTGSTNLRFTNNTLSSLVKPIYGPLYNDFSEQFSFPSNVWSGNRNDDGHFVLPNGLIASTDWGNGKG